MGRRRKALQSSLELTEDLYFQSVEAKRAYLRLARVLRNQLVTSDCLELLDIVGERIDAWASCSEFTYRHPERWPVYMDEREREALDRLVKRNGRSKFVDQEIAMLRRVRIEHGGSG